MVTEGQGRSVKEEGHWGRSRCLVWKERLGSMYYNSLLYWLSQNEVTYYEVSPLHVMCLLLLSLSVFSFICGVQVTATLGVPAVGAGSGPCTDTGQCRLQSLQAEGRCSLPGAVIKAVTKLGHSLVLISHWFILQHSTQPNQTKEGHVLCNSMYQLMYYLWSTQTLCISSNGLFESFKFIQIYLEDKCDLRPWCNICFAAWGPVERRGEVLRLRPEIYI